MVPILVLAFLHLGSVPVWAQSITGTGIPLCPYGYWHFGTLVQYQYGHIPLPVLVFCMAQYRYWHFCTSVQYQQRHIPLQILAFNNGACTGTGISALWFSTGKGTVHYQNQHSKMVPVPVLSFLNCGSVPVKAKFITGAGIQLWCPYRYWHFGTLIQYQYWHGTLLVLALKKSVTIKGVCALWFGTNNNTIIGRLQY